MLELKQLLVRTLVTGMLAVFASPSLAQEYPNKPITWIVAYPAGGGSDNAVRLLAADLSQELKQPVVVENRPGAATIIGAEIAAKAAPNGYTIFSADNGTLIFNPLLYKKLPYDPARDFIPVALYAKFPLLLVVNPKSLPVDSVQNLIALSKKRADPIPYGSPGLGSPQHLAMELFSERTDTKFTNVPYKGTAPLTTDLLGEHIGLSFLGVATGLPLVKSNRLRALAVAEPQRLVSMPEVPTFAEVGIPGVVANAWQGVVVPKGTPMPIVDRLNQALVKILKSPTLIARFNEMGIEPISSTPAEMKALMDSESRLWGDVIRKRGITLEK